jgi:hypothetical protein
MSADPGANPPRPVSTAFGAAIQPQATPECPWLGLAHFTEADREYFFGRDAEVRELTDRVRRAPLTVLYGVSGYGKSSILGAGLVPALRGGGHPIVLLRRCYDDLAERPLHSDVIAACVAGIPGCAHPEHGPAATLWEFFHNRAQPWFQRLDSKQDSADASGEADFIPWPVLLLDQFEEIFIKGEDRSSPDAAADARAREAARAFLTQLADLVENRPPAALRERLQTGLPDERRALVRRFDFQARPVRVAIAVRDDFLARLERWRVAMPSLMEHRVELRLLSGQQAFKAVFEPGTKRPGQPPILPEGVADAIVRAAAGAAPDAPLREIDAVPPILSLLCERLNESRLAVSPPPASITSADFSAGEAERILGRFYDDKLRPHPKALREYLEDKLVSDSGFRENVTLDSALASLRARVPDAETRLRQLVDDRVLVIEDRAGIPRVEFTHDTLARLALDRRAERRARARRIKAIAWSAASLAIAGVSLGLTGWALREKAEARRQAQRAREQTAIARAQTAIARAREKDAQTATVEAQKQAGLARDREKDAETQKASALALIRFMDVQVGEAFTNVPVQLRERVSDRLDAFYRSQGEPATFADRQRRMAHHMRKAMVHLAAAERYDKENFNPSAKDFHIRQERDSAYAELKEAVRLGDILATEAPDDRGVTRDRILALFQLSTLSTQLSDSDAAGAQLEAARAILEALLQGSPFSIAQYCDWMGLPNLDAAMGDRAFDEGDKAAARAWYQKALALQTRLVARSPGDHDRKAELDRIQKRLRETVP